MRALGVINANYPRDPARTRVLGFEEAQQNQGFQAGTAGRQSLPEAGSGPDRLRPHGKTTEPSSGHQAFEEKHGINEMKKRALWQEGSWRLIRMQMRCSAVISPSLSLWPSGGVTAVIHSEKHDI